jgi:UDP-N-acetylmuramate dehydrogenase
LELVQNKSLKAFNTFGIDVYARAYVELKSTTQVSSIPVGEYDSFLVLGGGSNVLFKSDYEGLVIHNLIKGISVVEETESEVLLKVGAGENWHDFVNWAISRNYGGIENLALIPGCVGAAPVQNIGAYGVELKDVFNHLEAYNFETKEFIEKDNSSCSFGYRDSVFKNELKGKCCILNVYFRLSKTHQINSSYGAINKVLEEKGILKPSIREIADAVIQIRSSKLPDPKVLGNGGSFFKNPIIRKEQLEGLKQKFPDIVFYEIDADYVKIPAGWLIDKAGWKGKKIGNAQCHEKQALVLVNLGSATGQEIYDLSEAIYQSVLNVYGIELEREVNIL